MFNIRILLGPAVFKCSRRIMIALPAYIPRIPFLSYMSYVHLIYLFPVSNRHFLLAFRILYVYGTVAVYTLSICTHDSFLRYMLCKSLHDDHDKFLVLICQTAYEHNYLKNLTKFLGLQYRSSYNCSQDGKSSHLKNIHHNFNSSSFPERVNKKKKKKKKRMKLYFAVEGRAPDSAIHYLSIGATQHFFKLLITLAACHSSPFLFRGIAPSTIG